MAKRIDGYDLLLDCGSRGSLWLADDHLLVIDTSCFFLCFRETYRRLDYANIHAVMHASSATGTLQTVALALLLITLTSIELFVLAEDLSGGLALFIGILILIFLVVLAVHLRKGPTAKLKVLTAVRAWPLVMVTRLTQAQNVSAALTERCAAAQSALSVPEVAAPVVPPIPAGLETPAMSAAPPEIKLPIHASAFPAWICMLTFAVMIAGEVVFNSLPMTCLTLLFGFAAFTLLIIGFSRGGGAKGVGGAGAFTTAIVMFAVDGIAGYVICVMGMMSELTIGDSSANHAPSMLNNLAAFPKEVESSGSLVLTALAALTALPAIMGLLAVTRQKQLMRKGESVPSETTP